MTPHPTEPQGETPLTDKIWVRGVSDGELIYVLHDHARTLERALSECRRELERGRDAQIQAETIAQLLNAAVRRLNELGDKSWKLPPYASRLAAHAESEGAEPVAWMYENENDPGAPRYLGSLEQAKRSEEINEGNHAGKGTITPLYTHPSPAPDSQCEHCKGLGRIAVRASTDQDDGLEECSYCDGTGRTSTAAPDSQAEGLASCVTDAERGTRLVGPHGGLAEKMPSPTDADLADPIFEAIWQATKTWDVNAPEYYKGYCGMNGSHVMLILNALRSHQAPSRDAGWVMVPRELTPQMHEAGLRFAGTLHANYEDCWHALLAAAPGVGKAPLGERG